MLSSKTCLTFPEPGVAATTAVNHGAPNAAAAAIGNSQVDFMGDPSV
jgi:hypothetical protein